MTQPAEVTVRFWAAARDAAGCAQETYHAATLGQLRARLAERHGPRLARLLEVCSFLVDDHPARAAEQPLAAGAVVEVLPPFAGG